jgi:UDP-3-O-[3-hydroxymyristoyl] glucosamine N-acyltransferase
MNAGQLSQLIQGTLEGNPEEIVTKPARIETAQKGDFAFLDNPKYDHYAYTTQASVLLVSTEFQCAKPLTTTLIRVADVRSALATLLQIFDPPQNHDGGIDAGASIHPNSHIGSGTQIGAFTIVEAGVSIGRNCLIYPQVYLGKNVAIGDNCTLYPGVRIHHNCEIGDHCTLHANAVIGSDGFGFAPQDNQTWKKIPHVGNTVLENAVEVGANTCIDRAAIGSTIIRSGVKIDNLVHIAHNVEIGPNTVMAAQVGIAGSARIGAHCQLGGQTGVAGHISLADGTRTQAQSGLGSSIKEPNTAVFGSPAIPYKDYVRAYIVFKQLPDIQKQLRTLEKQILTENQP